MNSSKGRNGGCGLPVMGILLYKPQIYKNTTIQLTDVIKAEIMQSDLLTLKNLGNTSVNWLRAVGIQSRAELEAMGPARAYNRIRERGFKVSKVLLYALQGALMDVHWNELDPSLKQRLLEEAERLYSSTV